MKKIFGECHICIWRKKNIYISLNPSEINNCTCCGNSLLTNPVNLSDDKQPELSVTATRKDKTIRAQEVLNHRRRAALQQDEEKMWLSAVKWAEKSDRGFKNDDILSLNCFESLLPAGS